MGWFSLSILLAFGYWGRVDLNNTVHSKLPGAILASLEILLTLWCCKYIKFHRMSHTQHWVLIRFCLIKIKWLYFQVNDYWYPLHVWNIHSNNLLNWVVYNRARPLFTLQINLADTNTCTDYLVQIF